MKKRNNQLHSQPHSHKHWPTHRPVTRRDFLAQGVVQSAAFAMTPSLLACLLKSEEARAAANCDVGALGTTMPAVLVIDHAGGSALAGHVLPYALGDQLLSADGYKGLGIAPEQSPIGAAGSVLDNSWGINFHKNLSFLQTLNATASPAAKALTNSFHTVQSLGDDTSNNLVNPAAGMALLGALGDSDRKVASVIGTAAGPSGGNSAASVSAPLFSSTQITSAASAAGLVSTGQLAARLGGNTTGRDLASKVLSAMQRMSQGQLARFSKQDLPTQAAQVVECGYAKASGITGTPQAGVPGLDPAANAIATQVFDFTNTNEQRVATLVYLLAMGFSGVGTMVLGGRDYHGNTRAQTDAADAEAAKLTGKALTLFHRLMTENQGARARPLMIIHITDGGLSADSTSVNGFYSWVSDRGTANAAYVMMYDPAGKPSVAKRQLGYASTGNGGYDTSPGAVTAFSTNAVALSEVFMINYLQLAGRSPSEVSKVFSTMVLSNADIAKYAITSKG